MKKFLNDPTNVCQEIFEGFIAAYGDKYNLRLLEGMTIVVKNSIPEGRVVIITGGGSGHEPLYLKSIGYGMADAVVNGDIFAAPSPDLIIAGVKAVERGAGAFIIHGNYAGDNMNFDMATEMLAEEGIKTHVLRVWDDVASAPIERQNERRGTTGSLYLIKIAGELARRGATLEEMVPVMERAREYSRTIGVALTSATIPATGEKTFEIADDEMEIGIGVHGEPGVGRAKIATADEVCREMIDRIVEDLPFRSGDEVAMIVNSMGATTLMELFLINRQAYRLLGERGIRVYDTHIGPLFTCQEMAGCMITLMKLDDELKSLYNTPAECPDYFFIPEKREPSGA